MLDQISEAELREVRKRFMEGHCYEGNPPLARRYEGERILDALTDAYAEVDTQAKRIAELEKGLQELWDRIEDKTLVRNISEDSDPEWAIKAVNLVQTLKRIDALLPKEKRND